MSRQAVRTGLSRGGAPQAAEREGPRVDGHPTGGTEFGSPAGVSQGHRHQDEGELWR
jgi:hypothetical protein